MPVGPIAPSLNVSIVTVSQAWFEKLGWRAGFQWAPGTITPKFPGDDQTDKD